MAQVIPSDFNVPKEFASRIPALRGSSNYTEWALAFRGPLSMLGGWDLVKGNNTHNACIDAATQTKWIGINNKILGFLSTTVTSKLQQQIVWDYVADGTVTYPSTSMTFWNKMDNLFGKRGIPGQFLIFSDLL
jgi:hypothetical protein